MSDVSQGRHESSNRTRPVDSWRGDPRPQPADTAPGNGADSREPGATSPSRPRAGRHARQDHEPSPWFDARPTSERVPRRGFGVRVQANDAQRPSLAPESSLPTAGHSSVVPGTLHTDSAVSGQGWSGDPVVTPAPASVWSGDPPDHTLSTAPQQAPPAPASSRPEARTVAVDDPSPENRETQDRHAKPPADSGIAIGVDGLHKKFKDMVAVESVSFSVPRGSIVALLGPNGAGKTTTVNMLCTLLAPDGGSATVAGHDVVKDAPAVRRSIMLTGQFAALDESLTGQENLVLFGRLLGLKKSQARARADELLDQFGLSAAAGRRVREYSGGMRRRIDIACGLVTMPQVVFLYEPTTGLDPRSRQEVWSLVNGLRDRGVTTLLTTQYLEEADALSDRIVVIDRGRVIAEGTSDELKEQTGASYCQVTPQHVHDLPRLHEILADLIGPTRTPAARLPIIDSDDTGGFSALHDDAGGELSVAVPAPHGAETLVEIVRRTTAEGIELSDIALRRPSLDEVFLSLTDPARDSTAT